MATISNKPIAFVMINLSYFHHHLLLLSFLPPYVGPWVRILPFHFALSKASSSVTIATSMSSLTQSAYRLLGVPSHLLLPPSAVSSVQCSRHFSVLHVSSVLSINSFFKLNHIAIHFFLEQVIIGNLNQKLDRVFFVVSGSCNIVRELILIRRDVSEKSYRYILPPKDFHLEVKAGKIASRSPRDTIESHFLVVGRLQRGDGFNIRDCLSDLYYISNRKVCLQCSIPW